MKKRSVSFHTLGCKLNFSETSTIARQFEQGGYERSPSFRGADICVVNTCSVTGGADKKCRNLISRIARENPGAIIAVTGCYAQLKPETLAAMEGVDIVIGNNSKGELFGKVSSLAAKGKAGIHSCASSELTGFFSAFSSNDRTRAFLKVQDGCSYKCSYCAIPYARGESRNIPVADIVAEAEKIAGAGQREIVITGINTGDFGRTTGEKFIDLLRALDGVAGIERYRISSIEPNLLTDEVIEFTAASHKFQPHFHIPLQSGCDRILRLMGRRYDTALFAERIEAVRRAIPGAFIGIDVIVGFPGETQEDFRETCSFIERVSPAFLHVFPYSERPGTPAVDFPGKVSPQAAAERVRLLTEISDRLHREYCMRFTGERAHVLYESTSKRGMMTGFTANYVKVVTPYEKTLVNKVCEVRLGPINEAGELEAIPLRADEGNPV